MEGEKTAMLLLMGGKSSRMGEDKAFLSWKGQTFFSVITSQLEKCGPVYISADRPEHVPPCPYPVLCDEVPGLGPVGALASSFRRIPEEAVFVCACDMPFLTEKFIRQLMEKASERENRRLFPGEAAGEDALTFERSRASLTGKSAGAAIRTADGRVHMTGALYQRRLLPLLDQMIEEKDYRLKDLLARAPFELFSEEEVPEAALALQNLNTPQDYLLARERF